MNESNRNLEKIIEALGSLGYVVCSIEYSPDGKYSWHDIKIIISPSEGKQGIKSL